MGKSLLIGAALASWSIGVPALAQSAGAADDATRFITTIIDKFNSGDVKAWIAAQNDNTMIVDEFGPHVWSGAGSPQRWLDAYAKDSAATGVTSPRVDYGRPLQATSDGKTAYVVLPTTYRFVQKGAKMAEPSSMTFVLNRDGNGWKIVSWTYSAAAAPGPDK
jgi:hypothetical protein